MQTLTELLHPLPISEFFDKYWTEKAVLIPGANHQKFADLFSWQKLNDLLNYYPLKHPEIRLAKTGETLPEITNNEQIIKQCQQGATLIIDRLHEKIEAIAKMVALLRIEIGHRSQVNSYCSFPGHQGFACHYDSHEVFILQISGRKHWRVFSDTFIYPLSENRSSQFSPPDTQPYIDAIINPGDLLYIPRGHWHYAIAIDEPSLHLTLGIDCQTGIDFSDWLTSQLQQHPQWRKNLPLLNKSHRENCRQHLQNLVQNWLEILESEDLINRYLDEQLLQGQPDLQLGFPSQIGYDIFPQGQETKFYRPQQPVYITQLTPTGKFEIKTGGKKISLTGLDQHILEKIFTSTEFSGLDIQQWLQDFDWDTEIVPLLSRLVKAGILLVISHP